jgi:choline kinase
LSNRFTIAPKSQYSEDLSVILLYAGNKKDRCCALNIIDNAYLINHNIAIVKGILGPQVDIIVVLGYNIDEVKSNLIYRVRVVENERFSETSPARSFVMGKNCSLYNNFYVIYGDTILNEKSLPASQNSYVTLSARSKNNIGAVSTDNKWVSNFAYNVETKWSGILYLSQSNIKSFDRVYKPNLLFHEVLNNMIDSGTNIEIKK